MYMPISTRLNHNKDTIQNNQHTTKTEEFTK